MADFKINVDPTEYQTQLDNLKAKVDAMEDLKFRYQQKKTDAENAWGSEDENLAKAQAICDSAIQAIETKIKSAQGGIEAIRNLLNASDALSIQSSQGLEEANEYIQALIK